MIAWLSAQMTEPIAARLNLPKVVVPEGVFWGEHLKTVRNNPPERLSLALEFLPLPGAFREAAIPLRAMIRERRKTGQSVEYLLEQLYRLAALQDVLLDNFDLAESLDRRSWESLSFPYDEIGYESLSLLSKTDVTWFREAWGEPTRHQKVQAYLGPRWDEIAATASDRRRAEFEHRMNGQMGSSQSSPQKPDQRQASGCASVMILSISAALFLWIAF